ncbi:MAG TPA: hypothetical protein ENK18_12565 [Deltaproteobacteria bacterium]|nr:hypothetical protein [Deltaproteobacteria bacterium]
MIWLGWLGRLGWLGGLGWGGTSAIAPVPGPLLVTIPTSNAPLVRRIVLDTDRPAQLTARWSAEDHEVEVVFDGFSTHHDRILLGWRPGRTYTLILSLTALDGASSEVVRAVVTEPLPRHLPVATLTVPHPERVAPGHTLLTLRSAGGVVDPSDLAVVYDEEGWVVWWLRLPDLAQDVREHEGGLLVLAGSDAPWFGTYGWDGLPGPSFAVGATPGRVSIATRGGGNLHHDVVPIPDGSGALVALGRYPLAVEGWPASYDDPAITTDRIVAADYVMVLDRDGGVLDEIDIGALIPIDRIGYDSLGSTIEGWADWAHANAVIPDGDQLIVSLRQQDAVIAFDPVLEQVRWILGHPDGWPPELEERLLEPVGPLSWPWHQHAPMLGTDTPGGLRRLVLFDNGNHQAAPFTDTPPITDPRLLHSRVVAYLIDEAAGTVQQDWSFEHSAVAGGTLFSGAVGDADWLEGGTVLSTWGFLEADADRTPNPELGLGRYTIRIIELDPSDLQEVWHLLLASDRADHPQGWTAYRAERIGVIEGRVID